MDLGIRPIMKLLGVGSKEREYSLIHVVDLNHGIREDLQGLLHLELWGTHEVVGTWVA